MITSDELKIIGEPTPTDYSFMLLNLFNKYKDEMSLYVNKDYIKIKDLTNEQLESLLKKYEIDLELEYRNYFNTEIKINEIKAYIIIIEKSIVNRRLQKLLKLKNIITNKQ